MADENSEKTLSDNKVSNDGSKEEDKNATNDDTGKDSCDETNEEDDIDLDATAKVLLNLPEDFPDIMDESKRKRAKRKLIKNVVVVSLGFVLLFSAANGLSLLQSSLNAEVGIFGLCANFAAVAFSCMFISTPLIQRIGCKWAIVLSMCCLMVWMLANLYPDWSTLIVASIIMGTGFGPLWTAQCTYFTMIGVEYANLSDQMPDAVISKMFGIFFMVFMTAPIWGNILSSAVLSIGVGLDGANSTLLNATEPEFSDEVFALCGAAHCPGLAESLNVTNANLEKPDRRLIWILVGMYLAISVIATIIVILFMDNIKQEDESKDKKEKKPCLDLDLVLATFRQIKNRNQLLLIPLTVYTGMEQAFMVVEYTAAFITCAVGVENVGFVILCYGLAAAVMSIFSGQLVRLTGRVPVFCLGAVIQFVSLICFIKWELHPSTLYPFLVLPIAWGMGDAIWQTQLNSLYGTIFSDHTEAAFSNYRLWESLGFIIALSYSSSICVYIKLYVLIVMLILGFAGYIAIEILNTERTLCPCIKQKSIIKDHEQVEQEDKGDEDGEEDTFEEELEESKDKRELMSGLANVIRRKSSVYIPRISVTRAATLIRKKSRIYGRDERNTRLLQRRLTAFVPLPTIRKYTPNTTPISSRNLTPIMRRKLKGSDSPDQQRHSKLGQASSLNALDSNQPNSPIYKPNASKNNDKLKSDSNQNL